MSNKKPSKPVHESEAEPVFYWKYICKLCGKSIIIQDHEIHRTERKPKFICPYCSEPKDTTYIEVSFRTPIQALTEYIRKNLNLEVTIKRIKK